MRPRNLVIGGVAVLAGEGIAGWRAIPDVAPTGQVARAASVQRETAYPSRSWQHPDAEHRNSGGIDRMHATSRVPRVRCRPMTARRGTSSTLGRLAATRQIDRDASGDRDHTAVVSHIVAGGASGRVIEVAEHSPAGLHAPVDALIAAHGGHGVIHYRHLLQ